jgi:putative flippase GtrA
MFEPGRIGQLARFCVVGGLCYLTNIVLLAVLCELAGMDYLTGFITVFLVSGALGYWLNKRFTFGLRSRLDHAAPIRYLLVNAVMFALGVAAMHVLVEWLHVWYLAAATIVAGINVPVNFVLHRVVSYRLAT